MRFITRPFVGVFLLTHQKTKAATKEEAMMTPTTTPNIVQPRALSSVKKERGSEIQNQIFFTYLHSVTQ